MYNPHSGKCSQRDNEGDRQTDIVIDSSTYIQRFMWDIGTTKEGINVNERIEMKSPLTFTYWIALILMSPKLE